MGFSSGILEAGGLPSPSSTFSFSNPFMSTTSFTDLLSQDYPFAATTAVSSGLSDRIAERTGSGVPKLKSIPPPSVPLSPPALSPSFFSIPPGLSLAELLDSPVLLSSSTILPSPTTGSFPAQGFNSKSNSNNNQNDINIKQEQKNYSDFSFQTHASFQAQIPTENQSWGLQDPTTTESEFASMQSFSPEISTIQTNSQSSSGFQSDYNNHYNQSSEPIREQRSASGDGFNWRKYGQKQVKGSENPRSYYKCTFPTCLMKKKVESSLDGQITQIVYKGKHNHPKPQSKRRLSSSSSASSQAIQQYCNPPPNDSAATPENSSISMGEDDFEQSSQKCMSGGGDEIDEDEPNAKRWKIDGEYEGSSAPGNRAVREPRVVVQTRSDIDILDDGYRWRKYGQKVVKGNPNPRSYYKCTYQGCPVRKHVERASNDLRSVITTYEGKHNHDIPAARGGGGGGGSGGSHSVNRPLHGTIRSSAAAMPTKSMTNSIHHDLRPPTAGEGQAPFTLEMLQGHGSFGFSGYGNSMSSYMNQEQLTDDVVFSRAKEEPGDGMFF